MDPGDFAEVVVDLVTAHAGHGGWYETDEGMRCAGDDELVVPSPGWLDDAGAPDGN